MDDFEFLTVPEVFTIQTFLEKELIEWKKYFTNLLKLTFINLLLIAFDKLFDKYKKFLSMRYSLSDGSLLLCLLFLLFRILER